MKDLLKRYENKEPEIVFHWNDPETEAEGWTVINSLRGGAAGGGTRMRVGLDRNEVLSLAKTMEVKFTVSGPAIGGAKSGINFDPSDPRKKGVLERWYAAVSPLLKSYLTQLRLKMSFGVRGFWFDCTPDICVRVRYNLREYVPGIGGGLSLSMFSTGSWVQIDKSKRPSACTS